MEGLPQLSALQGTPWLFPALSSSPGSIQQGEGLLDLFLHSDFSVVFSKQQGMNMVNFLPRCQAWTQNPAAFTQLGSLFQMHLPEHSLSALLTISTPHQCPHFLQLLCRTSALCLLIFHRTMFQISHEPKARRIFLPGREISFSIWHLTDITILEP